MIENKILSNNKKSLVHIRINDNIISEVDRISGIVGEAQSFIYRKAIREFIERFNKSNSYSDGNNL